MLNFRVHVLFNKRVMALQIRQKGWAYIVEVLRYASQATKKWRCLSLRLFNKGCLSKRTYFKKGCLFVLTGRRSLGIHRFFILHHRRLEFSDLDQGECVFQYGRPTNWYILIKLSNNLVYINKTVQQSVF